MKRICVFLIFVFLCLFTGCTVQENDPVNIIYEETDEIILLNPHNYGIISMTNTFQFKQLDEKYLYDIYTCEDDFIDGYKTAFIRFFGCEARTLLDCRFRHCELYFDFRKEDNIVTHQYITIVQKVDGNITGVAGYLCVRAKNILNLVIVELIQIKFPLVNGVYQKVTTEYAKSCVESKVKPKIIELINSDIQLCSRIYEEFAEYVDVVEE